MNNEQQETNALGLAGFIIALVGLFGTAGLLSPIGLILSLVALGREPKGFAIAGVVVGAIGSCGCIVGAILFVAAPMVLFGVLAAVGIAGLAGGEIESAIEMGIIDVKIRSHRDETGALPASLDVLSNLRSETVTDPWGNTYVYERLEDGTYRLYSMGPDGQAGTADDIVHGDDAAPPTPAPEDSAVGEPEPEPEPEPEAPPAE